MAVQPGLCRTWSETPKTGFLTTGLIITSLTPVLRYDKSNRKGGPTLDLEMSVLLSSKCKLFNVLWHLTQKSMSGDSEDSCYTISSKKPDAHACLILMHGSLCLLCTYRALTLIPMQIDRGFLQNTFSA